MWPSNLKIPGLTEALTEEGLVEMRTPEPRPDGAEDAAPGSKLASEQRAEGLILQDSFPPLYAQHGQMGKGWCGVEARSEKTEVRRASRGIL